MYTKHAQIRMQQRGIPPLIADWLRDYGTCEHIGKGAVSWFFDKKSRRALERDVGKEMIKRTEDLLDYYLIEKDGRVETVAKRYRRLRTK